MSAPDAQGVPRPPGDGHAVGQVVAAGSAGGSIYDLGYRGYTGPRLGRRHAVASLIRQSFRQAWGVGRGGRAKVVPIVLGGIATVPAVVALGFLALARQLGGVNVEGVSPIRYETYYPLIAQVVFLFAAAQAPELLGRDLRHRVLALYFSRAIEREDYALGKLVALAGAMLVLILFPQTLVLLGRTLLSADLVQGLLDQLPSVPAIVGQAVLTAGFLGALGLAIACWTPRRSYATVAIFAVVIVPLIAVAAIDGLSGPDLAGYASLLSPADVLAGSNAFFYGQSVAGPEGASMPSVAYVVAGIVLTGLCAGVLVWRYRRLEP